jgi:serine/threonine protein kinase
MKFTPVILTKSFVTTGPLPEQPGTLAKYLAPEVAVGQPSSPAADVWALGCAVFCVRSGDDLFFNHDTDCPADALRQIVKVVGELPEVWREIHFEIEGFAVVDGEGGEPFWSLEEPRPLEDRVQDIVDEPSGLFINTRGEALEALDMDEEPKSVMFDVESTVPYPAAPARWCGSRPRFVLGEITFGRILTGRLVCSRHFQGYRNPRRRCWSTLYPRSSHTIRQSGLKRRSWLRALGSIA